MSQCELAKLQLGHSDCCTRPVPDRCDQTQRLDLALATAGVPASNQKGPLSFANVQTRVAQDKPVCCAIRWSSGAHHFVQVDGYIANGPRGDEVIVNDSDGPGGTIAFHALEQNYGTSFGRWVWTYLVL